MTSNMYRHTNSQGVTFYGIQPAIEKKAALVDNRAERSEEKPIDPLFVLESKLLSIGGNKVVQQSEPHVTDLLGQGMVFSTEGLKLIRGEPHRCHRNCALEYLAEPATYQIATGYGLNNGIWCQHSWLIKGIRKRRIVETTIPREVYYGICLTDLDAIKFVMVETIRHLPGWRLLADEANTCQARPA
jgi:hypothetical protein